MLAALVYALSLGVTVGSVAVAVGLFAWRLERREGFARRSALLCGGVLAAAVVGWLLLPPAAAGSAVVDVNYALQLGLFSALLAAATGLVIWLFDASLWTALFCCTAGYALQNFASGLTELVWAAAGVAEAADPSLAGHLTRFALNLTCIVVTYVPFYLLFIRGISAEGLAQVNNPALLGIMVAVMLGIIGFDLVIKDLADHGLALPYLAALRGFHGLTCVLTYALEYELLVSRHLQVEQAATERVLAERERQYERSRENIEAINVKCHDIRHQIRHLADGGTAVAADALADIAREVDVYDSTVRTGNEALDTILTEKRLLCVGEDITLSCVADGAALAFMSAADIYSFFGNALDNAVEAVSQVGDPARRSISLVVRKAAGVVSVHVENYVADGARVRFSPDGLPLTNKADRTAHGFGVRSMRLTAELYGGTLTTLERDGAFHVNAMFPAR